MSTGIQVYEPTNETLAVYITNENVLARFEAGLGGVMPVDQFVANMLVAFRDPNIIGCTDSSKHKVMHECAAMGVLPTLQQVSLVPYKNKKNGVDVKTMIEWRGYKAVMERHFEVWKVTGYLVHNIDKFSFSNGVLCHDYDPLAPEREVKNPSDIRGGYCKILYRNGSPPSYHMVTVRHISKCQACAQHQDIWGKWYEQMALKTLYRDTFKRQAVPIDPIVGNQMREMIRLDDINLGNDPVRVPNERPQLTTANIMGSSEPVTEAAADETTPNSELLKDFLNNIDLVENLADLDQWEETVDTSGELSDLDKEIIRKEIKKRKQFLSGKEKTK